MAKTKPLDQGLAPDWETFLQEIEDEIQETQREQGEIELLLEQSKGEVDKLTQRNTTISAHLHQVQAQIEDVPPADVRAAYDAALEAQQRLVVMHSQLEKLNSDKEHVERFLNVLRKMKSSAENGRPSTADSRGQPNSVEVIIQAQESERQRLSRQMHDGPAQALSNFILQTEIALRLFEVDPDQARQELNELKDAASSTFKKVRDFIFDLRPMMLDDLGLVPTMKQYAESFKEKSGVAVDVSVTGLERRLESYLEVIIFRAVQELLTNANLHDQATQIKVQLDIGERDVRVSMEDNGRGFEAQTIPEEAELSVKAIRERIDMLGGTFQVDSATGQGTRFSFSIPAEASPLQET